MLAEGNRDLDALESTTSRSLLVESQSEVTERSKKPKQIVANFILDLSSSIFAVSIAASDTYALSNF